MSAGLLGFRIGGVDREEAKPEPIARRHDRHDCLLLPRLLAPKVVGHSGVCATGFTMFMEQSLHQRKCEGSLLFPHDVSCGRIGRQMGFFDRALGELLKAAIVPSKPRKRPRQARNRSMPLGSVSVPGMSIAHVRMYWSAAVLFGVSLMITPWLPEKSPETSAPACLVAGGAMLWFGVRGLVRSFQDRAKQKE